MESRYSENLSTTVFTPLIISATGIVATTIAIVVYHFIVVRFCLTRARLREVADGSRPNIGQPKGGLDPEKLKAIPILHHSTKPGQPGQLRFRVDQGECAVCLGELEEKVLVRLLPNCRHAFHVQCIDKWLSFHSDCPLCRSLVYPIQNSHVTLQVEDLVAERRRLPLISPLRREDKSPRRVVLKRSLSVDPSHVFLNILQRECDYDQYSNYHYKYYFNKTTTSAVLFRSFSQIQPNQIIGNSDSTTCSSSSCLINIRDSIPCRL